MTNGNRKRTANYVERAAGDVRENVDSVSAVGQHILVGLAQFLHQHHCLLVENVDEILQNLEMKRRCQHFAPHVPFAARAGQ